ncbi:hypothetical protein F5Y01DRAFT_265596 [Xylaria sp. FL0043]|nr:hypothetical protein F5Y01DRAFT_265596 [Xylaria sp. FL0043]
MLGCNDMNSTLTLIWQTTTRVSSHLAEWQLQSPFTGASFLCRAGRVTEDLLLRMGTVIDIIEPVERFTAQLQSKKGIQTIFDIGQED